MMLHNLKEAVRRIPLNWHYHFVSKLSLTLQWMHWLVSDLMGNVNDFHKNFLIFFEKTELACFSSLLAEEFEDDTESIFQNLVQMFRESYVSLTLDSINL